MTVGYAGSRYNAAARLPRPPRAHPAPNPLYSDPAVAAAGLARNRATQQANATLREQRSEALINYGDPSLAASLGLAVDPNTAAAAGANQYSTLANLLLAHHREQAGITDSLAGRMILHSGAYGAQQGNEAHAYGQNSYAARQQLLSQLNDYLQSYLGTEQNANDNFTQTLLGAQGRYGNNVLAGLV